jgi:trehalose 6-phosphate synthase
MELAPMSMSAQDIEEFYEGFSNGTLWPLYHDLVAKPEFHREWWDSYVRVNERFAEKAASLAAEGATVWVHDYQLQLVPQMLRTLRPDLRIGFYLHIPFPPAELFQQLPWRRQILEGLLGADLVGFQLLDAAGFEEMARSDAVRFRSAEIREALGRPRKVFLGVDRLDYTKGIYARLRAFAELMGEGHIDVEDAVFIQVAVPSREQVEQYRILRDDIERLIGRINGDHGRIGRPAVHYLHSSYPREEMAAMYRAADVMVVTPYRDGMNLVAKEYVACRYEDDGALVLSEFAGAADELRQAWLVNPYDINGMKSALLEAYQADDKEVTRRMKAMRKQVTQHDVKAWAASFMTELSDVGGHAKDVRAPGGE